MTNSEQASKLPGPPNAVSIEIRDIQERTARSAVVRTTITAQKIAQGKALIEAEIVQNDGIYPRNKGRLSRKELYRRAGVSEQTFHGGGKKTHAKLLKEIEAWLANVLSQVPQGSRERRKAKAGRANIAEAQLRKLAAEFHKMYEVEIPRRDEEIAALRRRIEELELENQRLQLDMSEGRLVQFSGALRAPNIEKS